MFMNTECWWIQIRALCVVKFGLRSRKTILIKKSSGWAQTLLLQLIERCKALNKLPMIQLTVSLKCLQIAMICELLYFHVMNE